MRMFAIDLLTQFSWTGDWAVLLWNLGFPEMLKKNDSMELNSLDCLVHLLENRKPNRLSLFCTPLPSITNHSSKQNRKIRFCIKMLTSLNSKQYCSKCYVWPAFASPGTIGSDGHLATSIQLSVVDVQLQRLCFVCLNQSEQVFRLQNIYTTVTVQYTRQQLNS